jgi:hypothetical protein
MLSKTIEFNQQRKEVEMRMDLNLNEVCELQLELEFDSDYDSSDGYIEMEIKKQFPGGKLIEGISTIPFEEFKPKNSTLFIKDYSADAIKMIRFKCKTELKTVTFKIRITENKHPQKNDDKWNLSILYNSLKNNSETDFAHYLRSVSIAVYETSIVPHLSSIIDAIHLSDIAVPASWILMNFINEKNNYIKERVDVLNILNDEKISDNYFQAKKEFVLN